MALGSATAVVLRACSYTRATADSSTNPMNRSVFSRTAICRSPLANMVSTAARSVSPRSTETGSRIRSAAVTNPFSSGAEARIWLACVYGVSGELQYDTDYCWNGHCGALDCTFSGLPVPTRPVAISNPLVAGCRRTSHVEIVSTSLLEHVQHSVVSARTSRENYQAVGSEGRCVKTRMSELSRGR